MDQYLGMFYILLGVIWMGKGVLNYMGKMVPEDAKKKLKDDALAAYMKKMGISCIVFGLPMVGLGFIRMNIIPMSMPALAVIVVLLIVGIILSVKAAKLEA